MLFRSREQEFANAQNAAGVPDRIRAEYNRIKNGGRLAPEQRKSFVAQGKSLFAGRKRSQAQLISEYTRLAKSSNARPEMVVTDYETPDPIGDLDIKIREKAAEVERYQRGSAERDKAFQELREMLNQQKDLQMQMEKEISID